MFLLQVVTFKSESIGEQSSLPLITIEGHIFIVIIDAYDLP